MENLIYVEKELYKLLLSYNMYKIDVNKYYDVIEEILSIINRYVSQKTLKYHDVTHKLTYNSIVIESEIAPNLPGWKLLIVIEFTESCIQNIEVAMSAYK